MKTVLSYLLILVNIISVSFNRSSFASERKLDIAMVLWRGETEAETGLKRGLEDLGYSVTYEQFDAGQDLKKLGSLLHTISENIERYDYIYTFGTTVSRRAKVIINGRVPQIFNAVTDPVGAGIVKESDDAGTLIGGASDAIPLILQVQIILEVKKINRLGLFFNPREKNSMLIRDEFYEHARNNNFEIVDFRSPPVGNILEQNLQKLADNPTMVDAVYFPSDSFLASRAQDIGSKLREVKMASFGSLKEYIEGGLLMGFIVDYVALGKAVAGIIDKHQRGVKFQDIPVIKSSGHPLYINDTTMGLLGIKLSESLLNKGVFYR